MKTTWRKLAIECGMVVALIQPAISSAQGPMAPVVPQGGGFSSKPVLISPITGVEGRELVLISATLAPGASSPHHNHPGDCFGSVIEGSIELRVEGKDPRVIQAGESYATLAGPVHQFVNVGTTSARLLNALVVEKGKPRTVTQPPPTAK